jgi:putative copper export protein
MPRVTKTPSTAKRQKVAASEALRLRYEHRESMWLLALATLVVVVGLAFMTFHIPGGAGLVATAFGAIAGKEFINSGARNRHP